METPAAFHHERRNIMTDPLHRIDIAFPLDGVVKKTAQEFELGDVQAFSVILTGYQECNIDLKTSTGRFIVKIFSRDKTKQRVADVVWGYSRFHKLGVPLPSLRTNANGSYIGEIKGAHQESYLAVFDYFAGKPLTQTPITDSDIITLMNAMATMHKSTKIVGRYYDTLGIVNLASEYEKKKDALFADEIALIQPVITKLHKLKIASFHQGVIHGSVEKENVLKNTEGAVCILDLGCMDYNATVLDIATFIANFSAYLTEAKRIALIQIALSTYQKAHPLAPAELAALPTLIRAQCASYIVGMTYHMRKDHDMSKQTQTWLDRGWDGLRVYQNIKAIL